MALHLIHKEHMA